MPVVDTTPPVVASPVAGRGPVELVPGDAALRPDGPPPPVHLDALHRREVDHQAAVGDGQAGDVVTAAAHGNLCGLLAAHRHGVGHVGDGAAPRDEPGALVDQAVLHPADLLVSRVRGTDELTRERGPHLVWNRNQAVHCPLLWLCSALPDHRDLTACRRRVTGVSALCREHSPGVVRS
jgi:hypothetical protein